MQCCSALNVFSADSPMKLALIGLCAGVANGVSLTKDNWDKEAAGKTVFVKFQAPW